MTHDIFTEKYCKRLNKEQYEAVTKVDGPVLLLAVPGSGKTTTLVTRLGYMIAVKGIDPSRILTLTYTVAATRDMAERYRSLFPSGPVPEFRTINGICAKIIAYYGSQIGKTPYELAGSEDRTGNILSQLYYKYMGEYPTETDIRSVRTLIAYAKNMILTEDEITELGEEENTRILPIYQGYNAALKQAGLMDYDDQLVYAYKLLRAVPSLLEHYKRQYPYICVDEAQDTSKIQHMIISLLAGERGNLFMVGDEDQSIYGFRAAYPEALLSFDRDHTGASTMVMDINYRSDGHIVAAADHLIRHNKKRHAKTMKTDRPSNNPVQFKSIGRREDQYAYLLDLAGQVASEADHSSETAILYRDNESALPLIDLLDRKGIPYRMRSTDMSFFTGRVVTDVLSIMRFAYEPSDAGLFMNIYYKISTYLKKDQAERACRAAKRSGRSIPEEAAALPDIAEYTAVNIKNLYVKLISMRKMSPLKALTLIESGLGYGEYIGRNQLDAGKLFILKRLAEREQEPVSFMKRLEYLQRLVADGGQGKRDCHYRSSDDPGYGGAQDTAGEYHRSGGVILSTIHGSKGLEYDNVYIIDICNGILPQTMPMGRAVKVSARERRLEEDRRILYVGMTRARHKLTLLTYGSYASPFIKELRVPVSTGGRIGSGSVNAASGGRSGSLSGSKPKAFIKKRREL
ncbi:ATP-dependent helicase [Butyrivibrio sp. MC2013]|uniref:ATP-dependent helicase n=1 Tax=Butyrivibrio sp. MC2013 TaxID=1280686 RepID=UPI00040B8847|nr:ATP-dependent helicase [Butyrivibrio sp. MC2013]